MRARLTAAVLIMQAISIGLAIPVWTKVLGAKVDVLPPYLLWGSVLLLVLTSGVTRKSWGVNFGHIVQVFVLISSWQLFELFILNIVFAALWYQAVRIGTKIDKDRNTESEGLN